MRSKGLDHKNMNSIFVPGVSGLIDTELPLTPIQEEILSSILSKNEPISTSFAIPLPMNSPPSLDLIQYAWQAVASHNEVLRTQLEISDNNHFSSSNRQRVMRNIPSIQFQKSSTSSFPLRSTARLVVDTVDGKISASVHINRALVDDPSVLLIRKDFESFFDGLAFERRPSLEDFIGHTISKDINAAKLFWRVKLSAVQTAPIHGFPVDEKPLSLNVTRGMGQNEKKLLQDFATLSKTSAQSVLYAAWACTLAVHTEAGNNRVVFSAVGRASSSTENSSVVGPCNQTYPLVVDILPDQAVEDLVRHIHRANTEASNYAFIGYKSILDQASMPLEQTLVNVTLNEEGVVAEVSKHNIFSPV
jgi:hypothetical protein